MHLGLEREFRIRRELKKLEDVRTQTGSFLSPAADTVNVSFVHFAFPRPLWIWGLDWFAHCSSIFKIGGNETKRNGLRSNTPTDHVGPLW